MENAQKVEETSSGTSALSAGLAGKLWIDAELLKKATMTPEQERIAENGDCPKCGGKLRHLSEADGMSFNGCGQCYVVWVLTANV